MVIYLLFAGAMVLFALVLRFVLPELIYGLRQEIVRVSMTKAFLDRRAGRSVPKERFAALLTKDFRYESSDRSERYALERITKIRELYHISQHPHKRKWFRKPKPQLCITELANLLVNLATHIRPLDESNQSSLGATNLLLHICNTIRQTKQAESLAKAKEVEEYLTQNPMSIEQISEILIAAVFAIAYRQRAREVSLKNEHKAEDH